MSQKGCSTILVHQATMISEIIETTTKNGVVPVSTSNVKLFLETIW